jgi:hypothetical protein
MEVEKPHSLPSVSWRSRKISNVVWDQKLENKGSQWYKPQHKERKRPRSQLKLKQAGSKKLFFAGPQMIGCWLPFWKVICFIKFTDSNANLIQKQLGRQTQN